MAKSIVTYWNVLSPDHHHQWQPIPRLEGVAEEITLSKNPQAELPDGETPRIIYDTNGKQAIAGLPSLRGNPVVASAVSSTVPFGQTTHPWASMMDLEWVLSV